MAAGTPYVVSNSAQVAEEQIRCYELKLEGKTMREIAKAIGMSVGTVHSRIEAEIAARVLPLAEEVRKVELDRLDRWLAKLEARLDAGGEPEKVIPVCIKVSERRCKLMGADAPEKFEGTLTQITQEDVALAELVNEARAVSALAEQQLREADRD